MITRKSAKRETKDLQRLLLAVDLMRSKKIATWKAGAWGDERISAPASAAVAAVLQVDGVAAQVTSGGFGGGPDMGGNANMGGGANIGGGAYMGSGSSIRWRHDRGLRHADRMVCPRSQHVRITDEDTDGEADASGVDDECRSLTTTLLRSRP